VGYIEPILLSTDFGNPVELGGKGDKVSPMNDSLGQHRVLFFVGDIYEDVPDFGRAMVAYLSKGAPQ
jgi:alpha-glucuronidase